MALSSRTDQVASGCMKAFISTGALLSRPRYISPTHFSVRHFFSVFFTLTALSGRRCLKVKGHCAKPPGQTVQKFKKLFVWFLFEGGVCYLEINLKFPNVFLNMLCSAMQD